MPEHTKLAQSACESNTNSEVFFSHTDHLTANFKKEMNGMLSLMTLGFSNWFAINRVNKGKGYAQTLYTALLFPLAMILFPLTAAFGVLGMALFLISFPVRISIAGIRDVIANKKGEVVKIIKKSEDVLKHKPGAGALIEPNSSAISQLQLQFKQEMRFLIDFLTFDTIQFKPQTLTGFGRVLYSALLFPLAITVLPFMFISSFVGVVFNLLCFPLRAAVAGIQDLRRPRTTEPSSSQTSQTSRTPTPRGPHTSDEPIVLGETDTLDPVDLVDPVHARVQAQSGFVTPKSRQSSHAPVDNSTDAKVTSAEFDPLPENSVTQTSRRSAPSEEQGSPALSVIAPATPRDRNDSPTERRGSTSDRTMKTVCSAETERSPSPPVAANPQDFVTPQHSGVDSSQDTRRPEAGSSARKTVHFPNVSVASESATPESFRQGASSVGQPKPKRSRRRGPENNSEVLPSTMPAPQDVQYLAPASLPQEEVSRKSPSSAPSAPVKLDDQNNGSAHIETNPPTAVVFNPPPFNRQLPNPEQPRRPRIWDGNNAAGQYVAGMFGSKPTTPTDGFDGTPATGASFTKFDGTPATGASFTN